MTIYMKCITDISMHSYFGDRQSLNGNNTTSPNNTRTDDIDHKAWVAIVQQLNIEVNHRKTINTSSQYIKIFVVRLSETEMGMFFL